MKDEWKTQEKDLIWNRPLSVACIINEDGTWESLVPEEEITPEVRKKWDKDALKHKEFCDEQNRKYLEIRKQMDDEIFRCYHPFRYWWKRLRSIWN